jgi:hypothetical protein
MSRYMNEFATALSAEDQVRVAEEYLLGEGFAVKDWRGETAWQKGGGWAVTPQFIKVTPGQGAVRVEAWLAGFALLPGMYIGEMGLSGFWGWAVKAALKPRVAEIERRLSGGAA